MRGADPGARNAAGWSPMEEAGASGDINLLAPLRVAMIRKVESMWHDRLPQMKERLRQVGGFSFSELQSSDSRLHSGFHMGI